ncbi:hypothetical protein F2Q68_00005000 [Brassica cretica]|uniref:Uncharacterized protein n=1 Tax=Brassica cretica TaxID=69181 RepID=A0A8S9JNH8_BRACR|nr:hypothetical protein F2Q68_00005000 [Brassica cretica]
MAVEEQDELPEATQREAELQRQIDGLQSQVTELHKTREETNPELSSEFQSLKEKLNEHSKQLEQSAEKLSDRHGFDPFSSMVYSILEIFGASTRDDQRARPSVDIGEE